MLAEILHPIAAQFQQEEHDYYPRPSLAGPERCLRQMVYWGLGIERNPLPGRTFHVFDDSSFHEDLVADWIRKTAFKLHSEQMEVKIVPPPLSVKADFILDGHIDGIITDIENIDRLWENKAINHFTFMRYWNKEELPLDNITQCALYLRGLNVINPDLKEAILLIKNKNTSAYLEYLIEYDYRNDAAFIVHKINSQGEKVDIKESIEHITQAAFEKFALVQEHIQKKTLPKRQYERNHWRCEYCGWGQECWRNWEKEFAELKTDLIMPDEYADTARFYNELGAQLTDLNNQRKEVKAEFLKMLRGAGAKEGRAGEYVVQLKLRHVKGYTSPARTDEILDVTKIKEG